MKLSDYHQIACCLLLITHAAGQLLISPVPSTYQLYNDDLLMKVWYNRISPTAAATGWS